MSRWAGFEQDGGCCGNFDCLVGSNLILQILAKLELKDLMRVRTVCKSWYGAILSPQFLELWKDDEEEVWAVLGVRLKPKESEEEFLHYSWYPALEDGRQIWYPFRSSASSSSSSSGTCSTVRNPFMLPVPILPSGSIFEGLLSSHGLVCGRVLDHDEDSTHNFKLVVGNPLTNTWKTLPLAPLPPPHISPYKYHEFFMERDPVSGYYTIVILLPCQREDHANCSYHVLQYESKLGTWFKGPRSNGPTLTDSTDCQGTLLRGSMVGTESWVDTSLPSISVYDPDSMAWSHMHIAFPETWDGFSIPTGFKYRGKYLLTMYLLEEDFGLGLGVWELDEKNEYWKLVSERSIKDLHGGGCRRRLMDTRWKCQLVGDILVFSTIYKPHTHGLVPPIAFNLCLFTRTSDLIEGEKWWKRDFSQDLDYECSYAFTPRLGAQV